jgi:serine/threonine protein kinase
MTLSPGQTLNNRYRIANLLGQGGFGAVYKAWDLNLETHRAIKENLDTSDVAQRQFKREAQILDKLVHPNLPRVIDHFIIPNQGQYLVMDFVEGDDLEQMLESAGGPLPEAQVLPWIMQVCEALSYLHDQNPPVIHRDIKPANIKITPQGVAMMVDFGIAKIYDSKVSTTVGARAVTPGYSPPEQYGMGTTDARSDVYALGATLFHLLTGVKPPASVDIVSLGVSVLPPVRQVNPAISSAVSAAIEQAMQVGRTARFGSVAEFQAALAIKSKTPPVMPVDSEATVPLAVPATAASDLQRIPWRRILGILGTLSLIVVVVMGGQIISENAQRRDVTQTAAAHLILPSNTPQPSATTVSRTFETSISIPTLPDTFVSTPTYTPSLLPTDTPTFSPTTRPSKTATPTEVLPAQVGDALSNVKVLNHYELDQVPSDWASKHAKVADGVLEIPNISENNWVSGPNINERQGVLFRFLYDATVKVSFTFDFGNINTAEFKSIGILK